MGGCPMSLDIGVVIARTGIRPSTLHLWERRGLIESTGREGLRRQYDDDVIGRIAMIVVAQRSNFTLDEIGRLLAPDAFVEGKDLLKVKLDELRMRRAQLDGAIESLEHAMDCEHARPADCPTFVAFLDDVLPVDR